MLDILRLISGDYTFRVVALGTVILGMASGVLSSFVTLNKQSLIGDALSHSALPGIVLIFMIIKVKDLKMLLLGALIFGLFAFFLVNLIKKYSKIKFDSALALILSSFFGFGLVLMTIIQKQPESSQAGLNSFIFGQASTMLASDIYLMLFFSCIVILLIILLWKEFKIFIFNADFAQAMGFKIKYINIIFSALITVTIIIGLEAVGVILISSLLVAPGIAARQWTNKLYKMVILSGFFGSVSGLIGTVISTVKTNVATGAVIVIILSIIALFSILFGKIRGIIWQKIKTGRKRKNIKYYRILKAIETNTLSNTNDIKILYIKKYIEKSNNNIILTNRGKHFLNRLIGDLNYES